MEKICLNCEKVIKRRNEIDWVWEVKRFCDGVCRTEYNSKKNNKKYVWKNEEYLWKEGKLYRD